MIKYLLIVLLALATCSTALAAPLTPGYVTKAKTGSILMDGTIYDNGNIGIGSAVPQTKLVVNGNVTATAYYGNGANLTNLPASMTYPGAGIALSTGSAWGTSITDASANWNTAYTDRLKWDGGSTGLTASTARASLELGSIYDVNKGTLTNAKWCKYNSSGTAIACDVDPVTDTNTTYTATANGGLTLTSTSFGLTPCTGNENYIMKWNAATGWTCQADAAAASGLATTDIDTSAELQTIITDNTGSSGYIVFSGSPTITTPTIAKLANLTSNGIVRTSGGDGTLSVDSTVYLSGNQTITLSGDASGSGTTAITVAVADDSHAHTTTTLSGIDIGDDTNLAGTANEITLTGDTLSLHSAITRDSEWNGIDFLVGTATAALSGEIAVGTTPGGELGGTWASPTIDDGISITNLTLVTPALGTPASGVVTNLTGTATAVTVGTATTAGTVTTAAQTAITSVGTLTALNVSGNVGIGTTVPLYQLETTGAVKIGGTGNVGIGTTTPIAKFQVNGSFYANNSGNTGLGTTAPAAKLQVGTGTISGTLGTNSIHVQNDVEIDGVLYVQGSVLVDSTIYSGVSRTGVTFNATTTCGCKTYVDGICVVLGACS
jgi:hypothetical protein